MELNYTDMTAPDDVTESDSDTVSYVTKRPLKDSASHSHVITSNSRRSKLLLSSHAGKGFLLGSAGESGLSNHPGSRPYSNRVHRRSETHDGVAAPHNSPAQSIDPSGVDDIRFDISLDNTPAYPFECEIANCKVIFYSLDDAQFHYDACHTGPPFPVPGFSGIEGRKDEQQEHTSFMDETSRRIPTPVNQPFQAQAPGDDNISEGSLYNAQKGMMEHGTAATFSQLARAIGSVMVSEYNVTTNDSGASIKLSKESSPWAKFDAASDTSAETGGSSATSDMDSLPDLAIRKLQIVDRLMVCVYDMYGVFKSVAATRQRQDGSNSDNTGKGSSHLAEGSEGARGKRSCPGGQRDGDGHGDSDGEENGNSKKRRSETTQYDAIQQQPNKRLACPYYKQDPYNCCRHRACSGPGWDTVHRLKGHLYRSHAMAPHCGRCYVTFENEAQVTDHLRLVDNCIVRAPVFLEGFNKDQERQLKSRRTMFQAGSEEEKWKIVYLILFPDTPLGELPSPYYESVETEPSTQDSSISDQSPEMRQFNAFMNRELPRLVRTSLEAALQDTLGPMEETLKNQLESIIKDNQETLTKQYFGSTRLPDCSRGVLAEPTKTGLMNLEHQHESDSAPRVISVALADSNSDLMVSSGLLCEDTDAFARGLEPAQSRATTGHSTRGALPDPISMDPTEYSLNLDYNHDLDGIFLDPVLFNNYMSEDACTGKKRKRATLTDCERRPLSLDSFDQIEHWDYRGNISTLHDDSLLDWGC